MRNRRTSTLVVSAVALTVALALAGCAESTPSASGGGSSKPVSGGVLKVGENGDEPTLLDPHELATTNTTTLLRPIFDTLVWEDADKKIKPDLASSWEVSKDGLTYTFHLRKDVVFQDGTKWNAEGLKANFEHIIDPATKSPLAASYIAPYESSTVVDENTLAVKLKTPYSAFLNVLAQTYLSIISPKQIKEAPETIATHPIGSGPFEFVKWTKGQSIELKRYDKYDWAPGQAKHSGAAYLDGITFSFVPEDSVRYNALSAGDLDVIEWTPPQQVKQVQASTDLKFTSTDRPGHPFSFWFNTARAPFNDEKVRQALVAAVDREQLVKTVSFGQWNTADGYITPITPDYAKNTTKLSYDVKKANALLDQAGWTSRDSAGYRTKDGKRLTVYYPDAGVVHQTTQLAELIQAAAKKVGVDIEIQQVTSQQSSDRVAAGDFDLSGGIWTTNTADVLWIQYSSHNITTPQRRGQNSSHLSDPALDKLLDDARTTTSNSERASLYQKAQQRLVTLAPAIPLYVRPDLVSYHKDIKNVGFENAYGSLWFYDTWIDRAAGK
jgi:peptide/nickel transport system substrate-binding protein